MLLDANIEDICKLEKVVTGMEITDKSCFDCDICTEGKMTAYRNRKPDTRANNILDIEHSDLTGSIDPISKEGYRYAMDFVDDYSGLIYMYFYDGSVMPRKRFKSNQIKYIVTFKNKVSTNE